MRNIVVERWHFLTKEQKISVGILSVCGVVAIVMSGMTFRQNLTYPFLKSRAAALAAKSSLSSSEEERVATEKRRDTDGDSLSDWDEINLHKTNPNLKDTCGDGVLDTIRVATGKNLACIRNGAGGELDFDLAKVHATSSSLFGIPSLEPDLSVLIDQEAGVHAGTSTGSLLRDPVAIRAALKGRIEESKLAAISDEALLELYDEAMAQAASATSTR